MAETVTGRLVWQATKKGKERRVVYPTKKGTSQPTPFPAHQLAATLADNKEETAEVELELEDGKPVRIRPVGEAWTQAAAPPPPPRPPARSRPGGGRPGGPQRGGRSVPAPPAYRPRPEGDFRNPYNFIPALDPVTGDGFAEALEQGAPKGHDRYHDGRWSGRIHIEMQTVTPLLIPDAARAAPHPDKAEHLVFDLRTGSDGRPYLPPTSLKGTLRAAYEAVTNSRLAVFQGHGQPLARRMDAQSGLDVVPARVTEDGAGLELWPGTSPLSTAKPDPMYAAWLPRYRKGKAGIADYAPRFRNGAPPKHGDAVICWLELFRHTRRNFGYWRVAAVARATDGPPPRPPETQHAYGPHEPVGEPMILARGFVCITNQNINSKHDERVFFVPDGKHPIHAEAGMEVLKASWKTLIANYRDLHKDDVAKRRNKGQAPDAYRGDKPGDTAWSRHIYETADRELSPGTLCYARRDETGRVVALYPVMISRELADCAPLDLLPEALNPATLGRGKTHAERFARLSPADRVFGWASQGGDGAWRGQLRIGPIRCESDDAVERFAEPLPLAILSTPKPQQARFYVARDKRGTPQQDGIAKADAAYRNDKRLRGRKVYPHPAHIAAAADAARYWDPAAAQQDGARQAEPLRGAGNRRIYREYRRRPDAPGGERDDQNRSIRAWVRPGARFTAWIDVINLNEAELGALLWLLSLGQDPDLEGADPVHRLGGGKPLGFGSVRIGLTGLDLADGEGKRAEYGSLFPVAAAEAHRRHATTADAAGDAAAEAIATFKTALVEAYGAAAKASDAMAVPFIAAFVRAACGFDDGLPLHYPRKAAAPDAKGENYKWFEENERTEHRAPVHGLALDPLATDRGLPVWE